MATTTPTAFSRLRPAALAALLANVGIVLTGGVVRITGSGLGCEEWPTCDGTSVVPRGGAEAGWHQFVEFGNRTLTFVVLATAVWAVWAARRDAPDRRDLRALSWGLVGGVLGQAVLGGITVLTDLDPLVVAGHFLLSMVLIAVAVVLYDRAGTPPPPEPVPALRWLARVLVPLAAVVLVLGTVVTATGPHAGDPGTPRLGLDIRTMAVAHADAVWALVALTVATWLVARALGAGRTARAAGVALGVELAQGGVGYLQYAVGIPPQLVSLHLLGACLVWVAVLRVGLATAAGAGADRTSAPPTSEQAPAVGTAGAR
jgi:cytochrome c oxidase assembly protein subunit 15